MQRARRCLRAKKKYNIACRATSCNQCVKIRIRVNKVEQAEEGFLPNTVQFVGISHEQFLRCSIITWITNNCKCSSCTEPVPNVRFFSIGSHANGLDDTAFSVVGLDSVLPTIMNLPLQECKARLIWEQQRGLGERCCMTLATFVTASSREIKWQWLQPSIPVKSDGNGCRDPSENRVYPILQFPG